MVSIITINYNGYQDTCELIDSLRQKETYPYEIIVVDNASKNEDGLRLKKAYPDVKVICSKENLGFAGGNNLGYQHAKGEYILYINNDIVIKAPFLQTLVTRLNSKENIGALSPKIKYSYAPDIIQYVGYTPMLPITIRNRMIGTCQKDVGQYDTACKTAFVHGACMLTSRKIIKEVGCMTEIYFLFYEELDWSLQLQRSGYEVWVEPSVCVYHKESMSIPKNTPLRQYYLSRSRFLFTRRNYKGVTKYMACFYQLFCTLPLNTLLFFFKLQRQNLLAIWRGVFRGLIDKKE
ncbi:glycosyltransferase family 2 protein [Parabacteroides pacaensis]|uniref:glycosyltransferase family 2 protein n=1 Tax=Parabacteroides pacaensis TaxID=2086575 RepID=UPI000D0E99FF|nr:glycosyltransferase family 2 protein [Parabacteroides pacaensis]